MGRIEAIETLYYNYHKLAPEYGDMEDTIKANQKMWEFLRKSGFCDSKDTEMELEEAITPLLSANEKQGFINGFMYASLLMGGNCNACK